MELGINLMSRLPFLSAAVLALGMSEKSLHDAFINNA